jgi:hypothetical protein
VQAGGRHLGSEFLPDRLWADGLKGRKTGDLVWAREDLAADGTHPSPIGQHKAAEQLLRFFKSDPTARPWFVRSAE